MTTTTVIPDSTPFVVRDIRTKQVVYRTTYKNRNRARRFADKKDMEYGAVRYMADIEDYDALRRAMGDRT